MKHLFIINPAAGSHDRTKDYSTAIHEACHARASAMKLRFPPPLATALESPGKPPGAARKCASTPAAATAR